MHASTSMLNRLAKTLWFTLNFEVLYNIVKRVSGKRQDIAPGMCYSYKQVEYNIFSSLLAHFEVKKPNKHQQSWLVHAGFSYSRNLLLGVK